MPEQMHEIRKNYTGSKVSVLGGGVSGTSLALLASRLGAKVFLSDSGPITEQSTIKLKGSNIQFEEGGHTDKLLESDLVLASSGLPPNSPIVKKIGEANIPIIGELDFVFPLIEAKIIGVTGSNGKTTTASLMGHLMSSAGIKAAVAGNIGSAVADYACTGEEYSYIVAELSSFQLHWAKEIELYGAVVTNLAPDHIDWHGSYENYVNAKARILAFADKKNGFAIIRKADAAELPSAGGRTYFLSWDSRISEKSIVLDSAKRAAFFGKHRLFSFDDTELLGSHNMENAAMAMSSLRLCEEPCNNGTGCTDVLSGLKSYKAPPHRCAPVLSKNGVSYVDDSKGTNIAATVTALSSIDGMKIIILGGKGKGEDYTALVEPLKRFAKYAVLIGEEKEKIAESLREGGFDMYSSVSEMEEAVKLAASKAGSGDVVLLSPACTSWDMYKNYNERGEHFSALVRKIAGGKSDGC